MELYEMEYLFETFIKHIELGKISRKETIECFKENNPGQPLPDHMKDEFSFPNALASICAEILKLKKT
jgi:hypothetical protein